MPISAVLRDHLVEHLLARQVAKDGLVFGTTDSHPFDPSTVRRRALAAWKCLRVRPIALHEARHTFASVGIAAA